MLERNFNLRIKKIQDKLSSWKIDVLIINTIENIRYLSGFTGSNGIIIITPDTNFFLTDSRYAAQAREEIKGLKIKIYKKQIEEVASLIGQTKFKRIGFEGKGITYDVYHKLKGLLHSKRLIPAPKDIDIIRGRKDVSELEKITETIRLSSIGFNTAKDYITPGILECDTALAVEMAMRKRGAEAISFEIIVASGTRAALPHGKASDKKVRKNELVIVDLGARYYGYNSDETCTFIVGKPNREQKQVYHIVKGAHDMAIEAVKPGVKASYVDSIARKFIKKAGYGKYFGHSTGHGIGLAVHEWPNISQYSDAIIEEGMIFTIEPGIYIPQWGGVRIEDMVLVTKTGCEVLTKTSKEMTIL